MFYYYTNPMRPAALESTFSGQWGCAAMRSKNANICCTCGCRAINSSATKQCFYHRTDISFRDECNTYVMVHWCFHWEQSSSPAQCQCTLPDTWPAVHAGSPSRQGRWAENNSCGLILNAISYKGLHFIHWTKALFSDFIHWYTRPYAIFYDKPDWQGDMYDNMLV